jgi:hypothetical protein
MDRRMYTPGLGLSFLNRATVRHADICSLGVLWFCQQTNSHGFTAVGFSFQLTAVSSNRPQQAATLLFFVMFSKFARIILKHKSLLLNNQRKRPFFVMVKVKVKVELSQCLTEDNTMKTQGEFSLKYRTDIAELLMYYAVL